MRISTTVAGLGIPSDDGTVGIVKIGSGTTAYYERLFWNNTQKAWVGRPRYALRMTEPTGMSQIGGAGLSYVSKSGGTDAIDTGFGFAIHPVANADLFGAAGLTLQEQVSALVVATSGSVPTYNINWYEFNVGDSIGPGASATNPGATLTGTGDQVKRFVTTGWQNSPVVTPTHTHWYPDLYGTNVSKIELLTVRYRWVGGTVGSTGGSDNSTGNPPITSNLGMWFTADSVPQANNSAVASWTDYSGFSRHLTQATGANQPLLKTNQLNGHAVLSFDGSNDYLTGGSGGSAFSPAQPTTLFMVLKQYSGGAATQVWIDGSNNTDRQLIYHFDATDQVSMYAGGTDQTYHRSSSWPMAFTCINAVFNGASSSLWENKTAKLTGVNPGSNTMRGPNIGAIYDGTLNAQMDLAEILIYTAALNNTDRNSVIDYLNTKYALF